MAVAPASVPTRASHAIAAETTLFNTLDNALKSLAYHFWSKHLQRASRDHKNFNTKSLLSGDLKFNHRVLLFRGAREERLDNALRVRVSRAAYAQLTHRRRCEAIDFMRSDPE